MRGHVRVALAGTDTRMQKIKMGRGLNVSFNRNGNFALLVTRVGSTLNQKKVVPLSKIPGSYRREFMEFYPPDQQSPSINLQINNQSIGQYAQPAAPVYAPVYAPTAAPPAVAPRGRFCMSCGTAIPPTAAFCPSCGGRV
jgi:hypothetical protein